MYPYVHIFVCAYYSAMCSLASINHIMLHVLSISLSFSLYRSSIVDAGLNCSKRLCTRPFRHCLTNRLCVCVYMCVCVCLFVLKCFNVHVSLRTCVRVCMCVVHHSRFYFQVISQTTPSVRAESQHFNLFQSWHVGDVALHFCGLHGY